MLLTFGGLVLLAASQLICSAELQTVEASPGKLLPKASCSCSDPNNRNSGQSRILFQQDHVFLLASLLVFIIVPSFHVVSKERQPCPSPHPETKRTGREKASKKSHPSAAS